MALSILSHSAIWDGFKVKNNLTAETIEETVLKNVVRTKLYLNCGGELDGVKAFVEIIRKKQSAGSPAVLVINDFEKEEDRLFTETMLSLGYAVVNMDVAGKRDGKEYFTVYPDGMEYAVYENKKDDLYRNFENEKQVCWFTWVKVCRNVIAYLSKQSFFTEIGGFASGEAATVLWQLAATESKLSCAAVFGNAGWQSYRGFCKFSGEEPQFTDEELAVAADIEAQSYAKHVKCPVLLLTAVGDSNFDIDRAYDTMARISERVYKATLYSFKRESASRSAVTELKLFYEKFLKGNEELEIAKEAKLQVSYLDGEVVAETTLSTKDPESVRFYYSVGQSFAAKRFYETVRGEKIKEGVRYRAAFAVSGSADMVTVFVAARYENGFYICSNIESVKIPKENKTTIDDSRIVYSSRITSRSVFFPVKEEYGSSGIDFTGANAVHKKAGPMGVEGVCSKNGLFTFKVGGAGFFPAYSSVLMFDVYAKEDATLKVSLISDYDGERTEYYETVELKGGEVWHNVKLDSRNFKTEEGMPLKSYDKIYALSFSVDGEYLINNVLWV